MHPKFHASSSFVTSIFLQYLANAVRACWGVIAFGSALVPALYPISLRWLLYESPYDHFMFLVLEVLEVDILWPRWCYGTC
ncbi:hypothetical protein EMIHUDRAFT_199679 [Emiliania huxleyi CCMP1516]|uniref:Uncharacterized protein n=2 Tax=Emiliania huxleyi TaxID=2903 RepID=A0A0D3L018_EMIH1|nr:hypothetical protein EMIHUDRAFT_199679 [Emiliania huxleyi CCMP1516]EOD41353.1 hypothetical protein EMIHUDRAFT_199679 [Emiliania huxleyi CCMP1516]|eukprot:XP_005793782.1 hypothetical protein EMIHUDRAFT_199679 [Emiliania huxleyi CCMP1516]